MRDLFTVTDTEQWTDCPGYEGLYQISDRGRVLNTRRQTLLLGSVTTQGYRQVRLSRRGQRTRAHLVHALVLMAFVGPRSPGFVCDHLSGVKLDNALTNLEWVTPRENVRRAARMGLLRPNPARGEKHYLAKLTEERVRAIRAKHRDGATNKELARAFGVGYGVIQKVVTRRNWKHIA